jgi:tetratricopeptide (TPR) repeat protein
VKNIDKNYYEAAIKNFERGDFATAKLLLKKAINTGCNDFNVIHTFGVIFAVEGSFDDAIRYLKQAVNLEKNNSTANLNLAKAFTGKQLFQEALHYFKIAISLSPNCESALLDFGKCLYSLDDFDQSINMYDQVIFLNPNSADAYYNKGVSFMKLRRFNLAKNCFEKAVQLQPANAESWYNLGVAHEKLGEKIAALDAHTSAIKINAKYHEALNNRSLLNLSIKNFKVGWDEYESRLELISFQYPFSINKVKLWDGEFCNNLLIIGEQGIGDQIFFSSMLRLIIEKVDKITVIVDRRLISIFKRSFHGVNFVDKEFPLNCDHYDAQITFGGLARVLEYTPQTIADMNSIFLIDDENITARQKELINFDKNFKCGISWKSANIKFGNDKSIHIKNFENIIKISSISLINLQYGDVTQDLMEICDITGKKINQIKELDLYEDLEALLSLVKLCDYIVTTCNLTAHFAGALGKNTFLLVPYSIGKIWYWHEEYTSSWYPSIKQFFQDSDLTWDNAINKIVRELRAEVDRKN